MITIASDVAALHQPERSQVEIDDVDDAEDFLGDTYGVRMKLRQSRTEKREGALLAYSRVSAGPFAIDDLYLAGDVETVSDPLHKVVGVWARTGRIAGDCDGMPTEAASGGIAMLAQPDAPLRATWQDTRATLMVLEPSVVAGVATGMPSCQAPLPIRFTSLSPVDDASAQLWKSTLTFVQDSVLAPGTPVTPLMLSNACKLLAAVTLSTFANSAGVSARPSDTTDHKPVLLGRAIEFMNANATNDIALADIAEAVHVTPRAVQYMFRRHLATTPLQYLRRLRLHYAHQDLLAADRMRDSVTGIAARWGFGHTGRFSVLYRQTYGQSPHTTLRS